MDSDPSSRESNGRKNIANILQGLGFEDTPESRKLDPWMTAVLARQERQEISTRNEGEGFVNKPSTAAPVETQLHANSKKSSISDHRKSNLVHEKKSFLANKRPDKLSFKKERTKFKSSGSGLYKKTVSPPPVAEKLLPVAIKNKIVGEMGGSDLVFVIEKTLTNTDVDRGQNRLSVPKRQVEHQFLQEDEEARLNRGEGIKIKLLIFNQDYKPDSDHEIKVNDIDLKIWEMSSSKMYVLNGSGIWYHLLQEHKLKVDMGVQLWAFRVQSQLYLALIKL